ncbi:MAG: PQQ-binding-like beta-propeller repeat protein [Candidatus Omnitrophota bacterium]
MKKTMKWVMGIVLCAIMSGANGVLAQDWPQWRGVNRDDKATGFTAPSEWPKELKQQWQMNVGLGDATPSLVGDKLYAFTRQGEEEVILCLNAANGDEIWRDKYAAHAATGPAGSHPGPRSTPTVSEGKVVTLGVSGVLSCLDASSGKVLWRKEEFTKAVPQFFTAMSPIVIDGVCIAHLGGKDSGSIIAFDLEKGSQKWKWDGDGPAYSSPVLAEMDGVKQLVFQTEKNLIGVSTADGSLLWQVPTPPQRRFYNSSTPIVDGQTVFYTGQGEGTKAIKIEKKDGGFGFKELWSNPELGSGFNTPVLHDGFLYGLTAAGNLFCINAQTGKSAWTDEKRSNNFGSIVDAGSVLLALPSTSELIVYKPNNEKYEELARYKVSDKPIYAHPIIVGNRIFTKDENFITLWTIK